DQPPDPVGGCRRCRSGWVGGLDLPADDRVQPDPDSRRRHCRATGGVPGAGDHPGGSLSSCVESERLSRRLKAVVGERYAFTDPYEVRLYQYDASPETALPDAVVIPGSAEEVAEVARICAEEGVPIVARSGASSLCGGTVPVEGGVVITFARMDHILEIDLENLRAVVEPGVVNLALSQVLRPRGFYYVPDPSSQGACTIGGNVGTNAGGPHTVLYAVSTVIASVILPAAIEMMDHLSIQAVEAASHAGYPLDAGAVLLLEVDGIAEVAGDVARRMAECCRAEGAREVRLARDEAERQALWKGRKGAFSAMGRLSPDFYVMDGVVPRTRLPATLDAIGKISERTGFKICNVFHAGDGNLHPLVLFDGFKEGEYEQVLRIGDEILKLCADQGGSITGEHGIGLEKRENIRYVFSDQDLSVMDQVRRVFDPGLRMNPGKVFPAAGGEAKPAVRMPAGKTTGRAGPGDEIWV